MTKKKNPQIDTDNDTKSENHTEIEGACNLAGRDLTLCADSSCLPGAVNNPWGEAIGAYGAGCGDCGMGTEESSWGSIKKRMRTQ